MSTAIATLSNNLAVKFGMGELGEEMMVTLKATAFKGNASDAQFMALMIVANQYNLNPWTKEIYAFPDKNNGIVPVVGVDGWSRIINDNPQFDGMDFDQDDDSCTCRMYRKDRSHPIITTEYFSECRRDTGPWKSHPKRMLRHKAMIQCARLAFGYTGIYDQDEAERIVDITPPAGRQSGKDAAEAVRKQPTAEDLKARQNLIADLEIVRKEQGKQAFRASWAALSEADKELIGIEERNRLDTLVIVIDGESKEVTHD